MFFMDFSAIFHHIIKFKNENEAKNCKKGNIFHSKILHENHALKRQFFTAF